MGGEITCGGSSTELNSQQSTETEPFVFWMDVSVSTFALPSDRIIFLKKCEALRKRMQKEYITLWHE